MNRNNTDTDVSRSCLIIRTIRWSCILPLSITLLLSTTTNSFVVTNILPKKSHIRSTCTTSTTAVRLPPFVVVVSSTTKQGEEDTKNAPSPSSSSSTFLPDYGTTPIEIDQIKIIKKKWRRPELFGQSLIEQTMNEITNLKDGSVKEEEQIQLTKEERTAQRRSLQQAKSVPNFEQHVHAMAPAADSSSSASPLQLLHRKSVPTILQINIGLYCNQACQHCHGMLLVSFSFFRKPK